MEQVKMKIDVDYEKVDIQENSQYIDQFNIGSVPTVMVTQNGVEVNRILGATTEGVVLDFINQYAIHN